MDYSNYKCIKFEREGRILRVTLNRPEKLNAVDEQLHHELAQVFYDVSVDTECDVVILTGAGDAFCAGGDVSMMERITDEESRYTHQNIQGKRIVYSLLEAEKPIICRLNGDAIGLGASVALLCDIIVADEKAKIGDPHVRVGLVAGDGGCLIWPHLVGYARAKEALLLGDLIEAKEAKDIGLINRVCSTGQLDETVDKIASRLANGATEAIAWTKAVTNLGLKRQMHAVMDSGMAYEALSMYEKFHRNAVDKFLEKRRAK